MPGVALTALGAALWGTWALFLRPAGLPGLQSSFVVLCTMSAAAPFALRRASLRDRGAVAALLVVGLADAGNIVLYFDAIGRGPLSVAVLTHYLAPVFVALLAPALSAERRSHRALVAAPASLLGLALLLGPPRAGLPAVTAALGAGSAVFYAAIVFGAKRASASFSPLAITAVHAPVSALVLLALFGRAALPLGASHDALLHVVAGGFFCSVFASALFYAGLARITAQAAGALSYLEPLVATLLGWAVWSERIAPAGLAGAAVILAGGLWVALEPRPAAP